MSTRIYNTPSMNASPQYAPSTRRSRSPSPSRRSRSPSPSRRSRSPSPSRRSRSPSPSPSVSSSSSSRRSRSPSTRRKKTQQINEYHVTIVCLLISIILYAIYLR